jgi:hypothetical protein
MKNKNIWLSILTSFFMTQTAISSEYGLLSNCEQQLVQASISCSAEETLELLESCIIDYLSLSACDVEVISESDVEVCEGECDSSLEAVFMERS